MMSCASKQGDNCSIKISQVEFTRILNEDQGVISVVNDNQLLIESRKNTDFFNSPDEKTNVGTAPILLKQVDNSKAFTFISKITPKFTSTYDAGTMYLYTDNNLWQKFAFEMDERKNTRIVSVRTVDTSDDNNHDVVKQDNVYMKISSDTKQIGFYYSLDKITWNLVRVYKNNYPKTLWIGISSQSPIGEGNKTIFEEISVTQDAVKDFRLGN